MAFKVIEFLEDFGVPYHTEGKNISDGWIGISCVFCDDKSSHGGISPNGLGFTCFRCGTKKSIYAIVAHFNTNSGVSTKQVYARYVDDLYVADKRLVTRANNVILPSTTLPSAHANYLRQRRYDPEQLSELYGITGLLDAPDFKYRVIIPIYFKKKLVTYIGRDITGEATIPYKNLPESKSILTTKEIVYGIDDVGDTAIIVEGAFDRWRLGYGAVALLGMVFTQAQLRMLAERVKTAYVCFDNESQAQSLAKELAYQLDFCGVETFNVKLPNGVKDPDNLNRKQVASLRSQIFGTFG